MFIKVYKKFNKVFFEDWYGWHSLYWKLITLIKNVFIREKLAIIVAIFLPKSEFLKSKLSRKAQEIEIKGYSLLSRLDNSLLLDVENFLKDLYVYPISRYKEEDKVEQLPLDIAIKTYPETNVFHIPLSQLVKKPIILELANNPDVISIIYQYLNCKPTLNSINAWWSESNDNSPQAAQYFHRDWDDLKFIKYFIYITDVDEESGPHIFIEGSHKNHFKYNSFKRFTDTDVQKSYPNKEIEFLGRKGSQFLEATIGIHKGTVPSKNRRLILQFVYTLLPIGAYPLPQHKFKDVDQNKIDSYISRLYIG